MAARGELEGLARLARSGSAAAWGKIYVQMAPLVFRLCQRALLSVEDAEDATGEIFLKARLRLQQYDTTRPFAPWLYRIAANHCWDELRKRRRHGPIDDADTTLAELEDQSPSPQEAVLARESRARVRDAVGELDDRSRLAIVLRYFADMSYEEIAQVLDASSNFVGVLLLRARRTLRKRLESR